MSIAAGQEILASHIWGADTSFPASPVEGQTFYKSDSGELYKYFNSTWNLIYPASSIWDDF